MELNNKKVWTRILAVDLLMLCVSFSMATVGQMRDYLEAAYGLTASEGGLMISMQSIGGFAVTIMAIIFVDSFNTKKLIVFSGLLTGLFIIAVGVNQPISVLFAVFVLLGFFAGIVKTLVNSVMYQIVSVNAERHMTLLHMLFSLASVIAPLASFALYQSFNLFGAFMVLGAVSVMFALCALIAFRDSLPQKMIQDQLNVKYRMQELKRVIRMPGMPAITYISLMVSAWQVVAIYSISTYFTQINSNGSQGAFGLSVLFLGMMIARLIYSRFADKFSQALVLAVGCTLGFLTWTAMVFVDGYVLKVVLVGLTAVFCGNNMPITYVVGCSIAPKSAGTASGIISFGYYLALFVFVPVSSIIGETTSLPISLLVSGLPLLLLLPAAFVLHKKVYQNREANTV